MLIDFKAGKTTNDSSIFHFRRLFSCSQAVLFSLFPTGMVDDNSDHMILYQTRSKFILKELT
jgi:hypothetical protein